MKRFLPTLKQLPLVLASGCLLLVPLVWWISQPSYIDLYVPISSYHGHIWNSTSRTTFAYTGARGVEYVLRRDGSAYNEVVGWNTSVDGLNYLDRWLVERGWERTEIYTEGDPVVPETDFLKFGETYAVYTRPEDRSGFNGTRRGGAGRITVAVWPIGGLDQGAADDCECKVAGFNVVVATIKPSFWKEFTDAFDD